jgi:hypothetical protein
MSSVGLFVWVFRFWQRFPGDVRQWTESFDRVESSAEIRTRVMAPPSRASPAIGIARDICRSVETRANARAALV